MESCKVARSKKKNKDNSHQTSIVTTNRKLSLILIAIKIFSRWTQENFFKYLISDYDLDRIVYYIVNEIDNDFKVVNLLHRKVTNKLKKQEKKLPVEKLFYMSLFIKI